LQSGEAELNTPFKKSRIDISWYLGFLPSVAISVVYSHRIQVVDPKATLGLIKKFQFEFY
jgi:hypothetical protein